MGTAARAAPAGMFYGYWVVLVLALTVLLSQGIRFAIGPFLKPVSAELGLDRGTFSLVVSLGLFLFGAFMPLVGRLVDRFGPRLVCSVGAVAMAASLVLTGLMTSLWQFLLYYAVIGSLGVAATGHVAGSVAIARWFVRRRGLAMSALGAAGMAGIALLVPVAMWLILRFGWRAAFVILGLGSLAVMLPLMLLVLRDGPERLGLQPDGDPAPPATAPAATVIERTATMDALRLPSFWLLSAGLFNCGFSMSLLSAHGVPMLTDHGFHPMTASSAIGFLGMTAIGGGLLRDPAALMVGAAIGGVGLSGSLAMTSALTSEIFGRYSVGSIFGLIFLAHQAGAALGSWLGGVLFDLTGGYGLVFLIAVALLLLAAGLSVAINERVRPPCRTVMLPGQPYPVAGGR